MIQLRILLKGKTGLVCEHTDLPEERRNVRVMGEGWEVVNSHAQGREKNRLNRSLRSRHQPM